MASKDFEQASESIDFPTLISRIRQKSFCEDLGWNAADMTRS
jgi:hypothetical protein